MPSRKRALTSPTPFTVSYPTPLPAERDGEAWWMKLGDRELRLSNLDKIFWPDEGFTKGDLIAYYFNVAPFIVPHLEGRPLTMKRMPDGISGGSFYEKSAPSHTPDWMLRCPVPSEDSKRGMIDYLMIEDAAGLLFMANLGCIEFHPLHSRCVDIEHPDYLFFDLDPFEPITFEDVLAVARLVKVTLDQLGLTGYPKTSGATGVQIYVPIERGRYTSDEVRELVGTAGRLIQKADPDRVTMAWQIKDRSGKVFIDHNMNRTGANISAAYCVRPEPGAPVSTPLTWEEVSAGGFLPVDFRIDNVLERFDRLGDLFEGVRTSPQNIDAAFEALGIPRGTGSRHTGSGGAGSDGPSEGSARSSEEVIAASKDPKLREYLRKRDFEGTPEPAPGEAAGAGTSFVIQKHRATRLHYDVRLERDGAMPSWAVPRGLPIRPGDRRLAVRTEDHPLEYATFEGTIPKGHYGAGEVRIFDEGTYELLEWEDRKVSFRLHGRRYPGLEYHFVKTRTDWLAILANAQDAPLIEPPPQLGPMLAEGGYDPFDGPGWRFEPKFDGIRSIVTLGTDSTTLISRTGREHTSHYPELQALHELVNQVNAVLDGEIVAFDADGTNSFEALQQRMNVASERDIKRVAQQIPVSIVVFDLLFLDGRDLTGLPLEERRELLELVTEEDERLHVAPFVEAEGKRFTEVARQQGLEGVVAKRLGSRYRPGRRSPDWRKIKLFNTQDCVILGWTPGQGGRSGTMGALLVGAFDDGELRWVGQVGTGFTDQMLGRVMAALQPLRRPTPAIDDPELRKIKGAVFVEPEVVCEVSYLEFTKSTKKMRAPSFKGLRTDKTPEDCILEPTHRSSNRAAKSEAGRSNA
jgi:bifunctional non-homologous end joining protein LigD